MILKFYPTADGVLYTAWTASAGNKWDCVNDDPDDGDGTYIYTNAASGRQTFTSDLNRLAGALINSVILYSISKYAGTAGMDNRLILELGGSESDSGDLGTTAAYTEKSYDFSAARPGGGSWSAADFLAASFEFGVRRSLSAGTNLRVTQVRLEVDVDFPGGDVCMVVG